MVAKRKALGSVLSRLNALDVQESPQHFNLLQELLEGALRTGQWRSLLTPLPAGAWPQTSMDRLAALLKEGQSIELACSPLFKKLLLLHK